jgi:hypothetical protein
LGALRKIIPSRLWRGQVTILVAGIMVVFLLLFLVVGIDFTRMYYVRGELQNAADAAALSGARLLLDPRDTVQQAARTTAMEFALKNIAAGSPVRLASTNSNTLSANNDITVGNWNGTSYCTPDQSCWGTGMTVNAIRVRPQRVAGLEGTGRGAVGLLFGKMVGWSAMDVRRQAIAEIEIKPVSPTPLCVNSCDFTTPLTVVADNRTPGTRFYLKTQDGSPNTGWSSFLENNTSQTTVEEYLEGKTVPPVCNECIYTTQGIGNLACDLRQKIRDEGADYTVNGITVHGWKTLVPILDNTPHNCQAKSGCFYNDDPGEQPNDAFYVINYAEVIITDAIPQGKSCPQQNERGPFAPGGPGIVLVGLGPQNNTMPTPNSTISCLDCSDPDFYPTFYKVKLVE